MWTRLNQTSREKNTIQEEEEDASDCASRYFDLMTRIFLDNRMPEHASGPQSHLAREGMIILIWLRALTLRCSSCVAEFPSSKHLPFTEVRGSSPCFCDWRIIGACLPSSQAIRTLSKAIYTWSENVLIPLTQWSCLSRWIMEECSSSEPSPLTPWQR